MYRPSIATRPGDEAPVRANDMHVLIPVGEWSQVSLVNSNDTHEDDEHVLAPEQRWKPVDDIRRPSRLPAPDYHHQNLADERVHVSP